MLDLKAVFLTLDLKAASPMFTTTNKPVKLALGDKVHTMLSPAVAIIDETFKTNFKTCASCANRRRFLNMVKPQTLSSAALFFDDAGAWI